MIERDKKGKFIKGHKMPKSIRKKISRTLIGIKRPEEFKEKIRKFLIGRKRPEISGEKNRKWKGDSVGYRALHIWVNARKGKPKICELCGKKKTTPKSIQWANKSGEYKRDLNDWISLCVKCHREYDKKFQSEQNKIGIRMGLA